MATRALAAAVQATAARRLLAVAVGAAPPVRAPEATTVALAPAKRAVNTRRRTRPRLLLEATDGRVKATASADQTAALVAAQGTGAVVRLMRLAASARGTGARRPLPADAAGLIADISPLRGLGVASGRRPDAVPACVLAAVRREGQGAVRSFDLGVRPIAHPAASGAAAPSATAAVAANTTRPGPTAASQGAA